MPKSSAVEGKVLASLIAKYKSEVFNDLGNICGPTATVWDTIKADVKAEHGKDVSKSNLYSFVKKGRHGVLDLLCDNVTGTQLPPSGATAADPAAVTNGSTAVTTACPNDTANSSLSSTSEGINSFSSAEHSPSGPSDTESFSVLLTRNQWDKFQPVQKSYQRSDRKNSQLRYYQTLQPGWSDLFSSRIWDVAKKPCCWSFRRPPRIHPSGRFFLTASASCKECLCKLRVSVSSDPAASQRPIKLDCTITGYDDQGHTGKAKRHLTGEARSKLGAYLIEHNLAASTFRKQQASLLMQIGDDEPPILPNIAAMRQAKLKVKKSAQLDPNPVLALYEAKHSPLLQGAIKDVAVDRFYCHYWTNSQMIVYKLYCQKEASVLMLDATGGIAHRLKKPHGARGGNIFLYEGVIKSSGCDQVSVVQMISERHDGGGIEFWLTSWRRSGAPIPKQAVSDMSLALIGAIVRAFTSMPHLQAYVNLLWRIIHDKDDALPECHVRIDVAHFIKRASSWKSLNNRSTNRRIKDFYLRCLGQLILSPDLSTAELIIKALIVVARSETNGKQTPSGNESLCNGRKQFLKGIIAKGLPSSLENHLATLVNEPATATTPVLEAGDSHSAEDSDEFDEPTNFGSWVDELDANCQQLMSTDNDSDDVNACWNPAFVTDLKRVCRLLPLWSGIAAGKFGHNDLTGSSAGVEGDFGNIKKRDFSNLPLRVDEFVLQHVALLDGAMKLAAAHSQRFQPIPSAANASNNCASRLNNVQLPPANAAQRAAEAFAEKLHRRDSLHVQSLNDIANIGADSSPILNLNSPQSSTFNNASSVSSLSGCVSPSVPANLQDSGSCPGSPVVSTSKTTAATLNPSCPLCKTGNFSSYHACVQCRRPCHAPDFCSKPFGEDEESRVCYSCFSKPVTAPPVESAVKPSRLIKSSSPDFRIAEGNAIENWRGKGQPPKKRGRYLTPLADLENASLAPTDLGWARLTVMQNGSISARVKIGKESFSTKSTYAFDTIVHMITCAARISPSLAGAVLSKSGQNNFLRLCEQVLISGVTANAYRLRTTILKEMFAMDELPAGLRVIRCHISAPDLLRGILNDWPSLKEESVCASEYCPKKSRTNYSASIKIGVDVFADIIGRDGFEAAIISGFKRGSSECKEKMGNVVGLPQDAWFFDAKTSATQNLCSGTRTVVQTVSPHVFVEVFQSSKVLSDLHPDSEATVEDLRPFTLASYPASIKLDEQHLILRGVAGYRGIQSDSQIGHYVAYCRMNSDTWIELDDMQEKLGKVNESEKVVPHLLFFSV